MKLNLKLLSNKSFLSMLKLGLAIVLLTYIFCFKIDYNGLMASLQDIRWHLLLFAIIVQWLVLVVGTHRLQTLLKAQSLLIGFWRLFQLNCIGFFFNLFSLGSTGGDFVKAYYVSKEVQHTKTESLTIVILDRLMGLFSVLIIATIAIASISFFDPVFKDLFLIVVAFLILSIVIVLLVYFKRFWCNFNWVKAVSHKMPNILIRSFNALHLYSNHKSAFFIALFDSVFLQVGMCFVAALIGMALNFDIHLYWYFVILPIGTLIMSLPISPSGLGTGELAFMSCFERIGISNDQSLPFMILLRFTQITLSFGGFIFWLFPRFHFKSKEIATDD